MAAEEVAELDALTESPVSPIFDRTAEKPVRVLRKRRTRMPFSVYRVGSQHLLFEE
jgi:hypothetical protein